MNKQFRLLLVLLASAFAVSAFAAPPFSQVFNGGSLNAGWTFESPNAASSMSLTGSALNITASWQNGGSDLSPGPNNSAPRLLQPVDPSLDWTIETEVQFAPANDYQGAGILLATTNGIFTAASQFDRIGERGSSGNGNEVLGVVGPGVNDTGTNTYMRVQKQGVNYIGSWSTNGVNWSTPVLVTQTTPWTQFGLFADRQPWDGVQVNSSANFIYFNVTTNAYAVNTFTWLGTVNNDWYNPTNWSPAGVPGGAADTVIVGLGSVTLSRATNVGTLIIDGGTLNGGPGLTVSNTFTWSAGVVNGALTIANGATANINYPGNTLDFNGASLVNNGTVNWIAGSLRSGNGGVITNNGAWVVQTDDQMNNNDGGSATFYNNGTFTKSTTTGTTYFDNFVFNNNSSVNVQSGVLSLNGGGILNGSFVTAAGSSVLLAGGSFSQGAGVSFGGSGSSVFQGGSLLFAVNPIPNLALNGGTLSLASTFQGGSITNLLLSGSTLAGSNTVSGTLNWQGGTIAGILNITPSGILNLNGSGFLNQIGVITNAGHIEWTGASNWRLQQTAGPISGSIWNLSSGVIDILCSEQLQDYYGSEFIVNAGLIRKMQDQGTTTVSVIVTNTGTISLLAGNISFNDGGTFGGTISTANGTSMSFQSGGVLSGAFTTGYGSVINFAGGAFTAAPTVSFSGSGVSEQTGGTLNTLNNIIPNLQLVGGALNLPAGFEGGAITSLTLNNQTLNGSNYVTGALTVTNCTLSGPLVIAPGATVNWASGTFNGPVTVSAGATLNLWSPGAHSFGSMTTNFGTVNWLGGEAQIRLSNGFINQGSGVLNIECDQSFDDYYGGEYFNNYGLITKNNSLNTTTFNLVLNNSGTVNVETGQINFANNDLNQILGGTFEVANNAEIAFNSGGYLTGTFTAAQGGLINLESGTFTNTPTTSFGGAGSSIMTGGTITLISNFIPNLQINGGTVQVTPVFEGGEITNLTLNANLAGSNYVSGALTLSGNTSGPLVVASNAVVNFNGTINGPLTLLPGSTFNWAAGVIFQPLIIPTNAVLNLIGPGGHAFGGVTTNLGTINWLAGEVQIRFNNGFYNLAGANFNIKCDQSLDDYYGSEFFNNYGTITKNTTTGNTQFNPIINNFAAINIQSGEITFANNNLNQNLAGTFSVSSNAALNFNGGGYLSGTYSAAVGAQILLSGGTFTNTGATLFTGSGTATMTGGTITLLSNVIPNLQISGGSVNLSSVFQGGVVTNLTLNANLGGSNYVNGVLNLTGNIMGPLTVASNSTLNWRGDVDAALTIMPTATLNWQFGTMNTTLLIPSNSVFNLVAPGGHGFADAFTNAGTLNWLAGEMQIRFNNTFYNLTNAVFNIECDQNLDDYYGSEIVNNAGLVRKFSTFGNSPFYPTIQNSGTVDVENGSLSFDNNTVSQNNGIWMFGINGNGNGVIQYPNSLTLGGTLAINLTNYVLGLSNQFTLVTYGSQTGAFAATNLPNLGAAWSLNYGSKSVVLTDTNLNAPTVALVTPASNQVYILPSTVSFSASTIDTFAAISSVKYYQGTNFLGQATTSPYNFTWSSVTPGYYTVSALATDAHGAQAVSAPVNISVFATAHHATNYTWTGAVSTDWSTPGNWSPNGVPSALDTAIINSGTVILSAADAVSSVIFNGGTMGGESPLTVTNSFNWAGGNLTDNLIIGTNATLSLLPNGNMSGLILNNYGTVVWPAGGLSGNSSTAVTNYGLWLCQADNQISFGGSAPFFNKGIVRKTAYTGGTTFTSMLFTNSGVVDAESGTIYFNGGGTATGTYNATNGAAISFNGGSLTINQTPVFSGGGAFYFQGGSLTLLHDWPTQLNLIGGNLALGPSFQHSGDITNLTLSGSILTGTNSISGTMNWNAGSLSGQLTVTPSGVLNLNTGNGKSFSQAALINSGLVNWNQGSLSGDSFSVITNNSSWLVFTDDNFYFGNGSSLFVNNGTFRKNAYTGVTYFRGLVATNNGVFDAESGSIQFTSGGALSGTYNAASGASIDFQNGNFTLGALPTITGAGSVYLGGGSLTAASSVSTNLYLDGGTVILGPGFEQGGIITNLTVNGSILSGNYTVKGTLNILNGGASGSLTIATNATLNMPAGTHNFSSCSFTNFGTVVWTGGSIGGNGNTLFVNNGLWLAESGDSISSGGTFINNSTYRKTSGGESDIDSIAFNNLGLVDVQYGLLSFQGTGVLGGTFNTETFGSINFYYSTFTTGLPTPIFTGNNPATYIQGSLTLNYDQIQNLQLSSGNLYLASTFQNNGAITNLTISGITLQGSNYVTGVLNWVAGSVPGQLTIASNATLNFLTGNDKNFNTGTVVNNGTVLWNGGNLRGGSSAVITNNGLWLVQCDYQLNNAYGGSAVFYNNNSGQFEKTGTSGSTTFSGMSLVNTGTLNVQSGSVNFQNSATYSQSGETLIFGVSALDQAGQLNLPGPVSLDGTLQVQFIAGYTPSLQDRLTPVTYASETGTFASVDLPALTTGQTWNVSYGASSVELSVLPPPSTNGAFQISGTVKDNGGNPISGVRVYATPNASSYTNLVQNGSFEAPSIGQTAYTIYPIGSTNITNWVVIGPAGDNVDISSYNWDGPAEDGAQFLDPSGNTGGAGVQQTISTVSGTSYDLIFYHGTENQRGYNNVLGVTIGTNNYTYGETSGSAGNFDWRRVEIPFVATSNRTTISFNELTGGNNDDGFVDNVQVVTSDYYDSLLEAVTDSSGHYQILAPNATFQVGVSGLGAVGFQNVSAQTIAVNNANATANFVATPLSGVQFYAISTAASPSTAGTATGGGSFVSGASITVTATVTNTLPYVFANWTENGIVQSTSPSYSFTVLRSRNLVANFALPSEVVSTTVSPANSGTVVGGGSYTYNSPATLTASANFGFQFAQWTDQNNNVLGSSPSLVVTVLSNATYTAYFTATNLNHYITTGTLPANLASVSGAGKYTNGQTASISAPPFVTNGLTYFQFSQFQLNGNAFTNTNAFSWPITTALQSNLVLTAVYGAHSVLPLVAGVQANIQNPVKATTTFALTIQFDRSMQSSPDPLVVLTNQGATQPTVPTGGTWSTTAISNDTYTTPAIAFVHGMDGTNLVFVSQAIDLRGDAVLLTNVYAVDVDATPPIISNISVTPGTLSATVTWNTSEPATSEVNYGPTATYNASTGVNGQLLTSHSLSLSGLNAVSTYHYQIVSHDQAGNQTVTPDATFATIAAPDLQVTGLAISPGLSSGSPATISWVDTNTGTGATFSTWYDHVTVSNVTTHQSVLDTTSYYDPSVNGNIAGLAGKARSYAWTVPNGSNGAGSLFITITANTYSNQFEVTTANNSESISASSTLSLYPDLQVVKLTATPSSPTSGSTITLNWVDTNTGTGPVTGSFSDQVVVTNLTTSAILYNNSLAYNESTSGAIAANQGVPRSVTFALPNGAAGVGTLGIGILANAGADVYEYNSGGTAQRNNTNSLTIVSSLAAYPDLAVTNITAPASVPAGGTFNATWVDVNRGTAPATNSWTENVLLSQDGTTNTSQLIGSFTQSAPLAPGQSITNTNSIQLPNFVSGNQWVVVQINANNSVFVLDHTNSRAVAKQATVVNADLALNVSPNTFAKNVANPAATGTITRYGSTTAALTVSLSSGNTGAATVPTSVVIPAGQSSATFHVSAVNDNIVDGTRAVNIIASANGYANVTDSITVTDPTVPTLTLAVGANTVGVSTNPIVACSVSRNTATTSPLVVNLITDPTKLTAPATVTIPAGSASANFNVQTVNAHLPLATVATPINVSATGFASQGGSLTIVDDDAPQLSLTFANTVVSKGAVNPATIATLTVSTATTQAVTVLLATVSPAITIPGSAVIPANKTNVTFPVNVVQDNLVTGDRVAVVSAELADVYSAIAIPATATTAQITVTDDNGPSLSVALANTTIAENGSTTATVTRNTLPTNALTVNLASTLTTAASVPATVTIPINSASKTFTVTGVNPGVPTGPRVADITAAASGYGSGVAPLTVSDINIPDLVVTSVTAPTTGLTTSNITVTYVIANTGLGATTNSWHDAVYYSTSPDGSNPQLLTEVFESLPLAVGQSRTNNILVKLPSVPGSDYIVASVNIDSAVLEANYQNDTLVTTVATTNSPTYHAFIQSDITEGISPTPVPMNGYTYSALSPNQHVPNVPVNIGVLVKGTLRNFTVTTDGNGNFTNNFQPIPGEAGHYGLTADYPGVPNTAVQSSFDLFGVRITDNQENIKVYPGSPVTNSTTVVNLSDLPLTGVQAVPVGFPSGVNVQITVTNGLGADDSATLSYNISVGNLTSAETAQAYIEVTTDQGAVAYLPFNITLAPQTAQLVCNPVTLLSSMLIGQQTLVDFDIQNVGGADSGPITLQLPATATWLTAVTSTNIPSIAPGQSNRVIIALNPALTLPLQQYSGSLFAADAAGGVNIPFTFRAISDAIGGLQVAVQDEYTFFVAGSPQVTNAQVILTDPITGSVVASNVTDQTGTVLFSSLDQGSYQMTVSAVKHSTYQSPVTIQPGTVAQATAFISRQTVSYTWTVVPTTVQDQYQVTLQPQFETEVPIPVVVVSNPLQIPLIIQGRNSEVDFQIANTGLIAAQQISLNLPTDDPNYIYTPLSDTIDEIPANTTITLPVLISWKTNANNPDFVKKSYARQRAASPGKTDSPGCELGANIGVNWSYVCGPDRHYHLTPTSVYGFDISQACADIAAVCINAQPGAAAGVAVNVSACAVFGCIQNCAPPNACLNSIVSAVCGAGDVQAAVNAALASGNCTCQQTPPLPSIPNTPPNTPPPVTQASQSSSSPPGGAQDPYPDPVDWSLQGCTPGQSGGPAGGNATPQLISVRKTDGGPTTAAGDVCAHVTIQLEQQIALTRNAFKGSLVIDDSDSNDLTSVLVALAITDDNGNSANDLFGIQPPALAGVSAVDGTGVIAGDSSGTVQYTFVPTHDAAPTLPVHYKVGGTLSYVQSGNTVTITLAPQDIYVYPDPVLDLNYFLQRDVIGDDPEEPGTVTPQPFNLGLIVKNSGYGSALDFTITSAQPQIVENLKGLDINFQLLGTEVGTNILTPSLTADLGTLAPQSATVAIWQLECSLAGRFTSYSASYKQISQLGSAQTSLIDSVNIHQMIHTFLAVRPTDDEVPDFLVNDIPNSNNLPDTVYLSDGSTNAVTVIYGAQTDAPISPGHMQAVLTASMSNGWNYLEAADPGPGYVLYRAVRSDGLDMKVPYNVWTTPLSFPASQTGALHTNLVHLVDYNGSGSYTLYYRNTNTTAPSIVGLQSITPYIQSGPVSSVQITFSEAIDPSTFSTSALSLTLNGGPNLINSGVTITLVTNGAYSINGLSSLTASQGNYQLSVNASNVLDFGGNAITGGSTISTTWAEGNPPVAVQNIQPITPNPRNTPVNSITVTFDKALTASTFNYSAISLTLNGGPNLSSPGITVSQVNSTTYQINGLAALTGAAGTYTLTINAGALQDSGGNPGSGSISTSWTVITSGPGIALLPAPQTPRNIAVQSQSVTLSEPINPATFTPSALSLTLNGGANLIAGNVNIAQVSPTNFIIQNLGSLTGSNGAYVLTVNAASLTDLAGNSGVGSSNVTWVMNLVQPPAPSNLAIAPKTGLYPNLTASNAVTLSGTIASNGLTVRVIDQTTSQDWGTATVTGKNFSEQLTLAQGSHTLQVYAVDSAANVSTNTLLTVVVDQTPISATFDAINPNPRTTALPNLNITFDKPMDITTVHASNIVLTLNGTNLFFPTLTMVSSNVFQIGGMAAFTAAQGAYQLTVNYNGMRDDAGNAGSGSGSTSWSDVASLLPIISQVGNVSLQPDQKLKLVLSTNDPSSFPLTLVLTAAPDGLSLSNTTIAWTPTCAQGGSSNVVTVWAVETVSPYLSNSMSFAVIVADCADVQIGSTVVAAGTAGSLPLNILATGSLTNLSFILNFPTNRLAGWSIQPSNAAVNTLAVQSLSATQSVFTLTSRSGQSLIGSGVVGSLAFNASAGPSAFIPLTLAGLTATELNNVNLVTTLSTNGRVVIVGAQPLLESQFSRTSPNLSLYGLPGQSYQIQASTNLGNPNGWTNWIRVPVTNLTTVLQNLDLSAPGTFFRAYAFQAAIPLLDLAAPIGNGLPGLTAYGIKGTNYQLQFSTNLTGNNWSPVLSFTLSNSFQSLTNTGATKGSTFYRLKMQ